MGDALNGVVRLSAGGDDYKLHYSIDALCTLEDRLDMDVMAIGQKMQSGMRLSMLRAVLWAGLLEHHEDISEREAGELIPLAGGAVVIANKIGEAFLAAFPKEEAKAKKGPPKRARPRGTGKNS